MSGWLRRYRVLMAFSFAAAPWQAALFLLSGAVMSLIGPGMALGAKLLVDAGVGGNVRLGLIAAALLAGAAGLNLLNSLYYIDLLFTVAEKAGAAVDRRLIELMADVPSIEHHERPDYLDQLDLLREERSRLGYMTNATAGLLRVAVQLAASGVLLARVDPWLLLLPVVGVASFVTGRRAQDLQLRALEETAEPERLRRHLFETGTSAEAGKEVRVFDLGQELVKRHHDASSAVLAVRDRAEWQGAVLQAAGGVVYGAAYIAAIWLVLLRAIHGQATPGDVVLAVGLAATMNNLIFTAVAYGTSFLRILRLAGRYLWLADYVQRTYQPPDVPATVPRRLDRGIDFQKVSFRYADGDRLVLDDVSLHLPAGSVVALVGENGAGKTTLVKLLCRFYEPTAGHIEVDGVELRRFPADEWRTRIAGAYQDFVRFEFMARETVGVGDLPRIEEVAAVEAALARAGASELPRQLPSGLQTQLGRNWEHGIELSGGQWQKLALGRAMMRDAPLLLILDEPTASLDADTEHALFERYARAARDAAAAAGTVTLLVSHRFSTVRMADLIVVLERGRISELGSHAELMRQGGLYAELYELQARAYR